MDDVIRLGKHFVLYDGEQLNMEGLFADLFWIIRAQLQGVPVWKLRSRSAQTIEN